jgi:hypothetical protein
VQERDVIKDVIERLIKSEGCDGMMSGCQVEVRTVLFSCCVCVGWGGGGGRTVLLCGIPAMNFVCLLCAATHGLHVCVLRGCTWGGQLQAAGCAAMC